MEAVRTAVSLLMPAQRVLSNLRERYAADLRGGAKEATINHRLRHADGLKICAPR